MAKYSAKFEVDNEVRIIEGIYPRDYYNPKITLRNEYVGRVGSIRSVDTDYPEGYLPDYRVVFEDGGYEQFDEVNLELVAVAVGEAVIQAQAPMQYIIEPGLALHALSILENIEKKLDALSVRLAAHEARANQATSVVINVTGQAEVAAPEVVVKQKPIAFPWLDMHDKELILETFKVGDKVEFTKGPGRKPPFVGTIDYFEDDDEDQFLAVSYDRDLYDGTRWPDLSVRKVRKVVE